MKKVLSRRWQQKQIEATDALMQQICAPERVAAILEVAELGAVKAGEYADWVLGGMQDASRKESVAAARETDRRLKARSRGRMNRILDITYQAIRRRPEVFQ